MNASVLGRFAVLSAAMAFALIMVWAVIRPYFFDAPAGDYETRQGDILFFHVQPTGGHMEIIYAVDGSVICSIGGNVRNQVQGRCTPMASGRLLAIGAIPPEAFD